MKFWDTPIKIKKPKPRPKKFDAHTINIGDKVWATYRTRKGWGVVKDKNDDGVYVESEAGNWWYTWNGYWAGDPSRGRIYYDKPEES